VKILFLTKSSAFQNYCVNELSNCGYSIYLVIESGQSVPGERHSQILKRFINKLWFIIKNPLSIMSHVNIFLNSNKYYGNKEFHNKRILKKKYDYVNKNIQVYYVDSINSKEFEKIVKNISPSLTLVFGTGIIGKKIIHLLPKPIINMHWGWSPNYRGEGIITALAIGGERDLGVTIHLLNEEVDGGDILYRRRPRIDSEDNFYSIGLKLTVLGTEMFKEFINSFQTGKKLDLEQQNNNIGRFYDSKYMQENPKIHILAWNNLKNNVKS
jgi:methionyl-tRNA formyltransferase